MSNKYYEAVSKHPLERTITDKILCEQYQDLKEYVVVYITVEMKSTGSHYWLPVLDAGEMLTEMGNFTEATRKAFCPVACVEAFRLKRRLEMPKVIYTPIIMTMVTLRDIMNYCCEHPDKTWTHEDYGTILQREAITPSDYWLMWNAHSKLSDPFAGIDNPLKNAEYSAEYNKL
tara:strand:+ start:3030 stop:3551 length:522 start_codon:yes stop_codon:yes gene_type:complete